MTKYDVYIVNNLIDNEEASKDALSAAKANIAQRFKLPPEKVEALFKQRRVVIKRGVSESVAKKLAGAIESCGVESEIVALNKEPEETLSLTPIEPTSPAPASQQATEPTNATVADKKGESIYSAPTASVDKDLFCRQCGARMAANASTCPSCGAAAPIQENGPSKVAAGFLAFFLGGFGIHRFYLRQWWGVFYIPFGLLGVIFPVTLIEAIYFWAMSNAKWQQKYGHLPKSSALVIVAICIVPFIAVVGILAAIALPAYQDYTHRAKVSEGLIALHDTAREVARVTVNAGTPPASLDDAGISIQVTSTHLQSVELNESGAIVGTYIPFANNGNAMTITLEPNYVFDGELITAVSWSCKGGTMPDKYRPPDCRGGSDAAPAEKATVGSKTLRSVESTATLQVPSSWKEGVAENDEASINAGNIYREAYVLLLEEEDDEAYFSGLVDFGPAIEDYYASALTDFKLLSRSDITSDEGRPGKILKFSAHEDGYDIVYMVALYHDHNRYYQVFTWSLENRFSQNEAAFFDAVKSFHP
ncbi:NINE protein [Aurantivibrio plasticivorans]